MDEKTRTLVERARDRDPDAVEKLFARYREPLRRALHKLVSPAYRKSLADSEDAVQDAILSALKRLERFEYRGQGSFLAWLLKCAENEILHKLRAMATLKRDQERVQPLDASSFPEPVDGGATPSQVMRGKEMEDRVRACLEQLLPQESEAIYLRRYLDCEMEEIREELDLPSAGAVRALLSRAQAKLAALILASDEEP